MRKLRPFLASFLLHAFLLVTVLVSFQTPLSSPTPTLIDVDMLVPRGGSLNKGSSPFRLNLGDLAIGKSSPIRPADDSGSEVGNGFETAQGMDLATESKLYPFFHSLWRKIDASLGYPKDFVQARIQGSVQLQIEVDEKGVFTGKVLKLDSDSKYLKTYVFAILTHALKTPLPPQQWNTAGRINLITKFDFDIFTTGHNAAERKAEHMKNILAFKRSAYAVPKLNEYIEQLFTRYIPPIIPVPGGFVIDFIRAYEMIEAIGKPDPDDRRDDRIQLMMQEWDRIVRKENDSTQ